MVFFLTVVSFPRLCEDDTGKAETDTCITSRSKTVGFRVPTKSQLLFVPVAPESSTSLCLLLFAISLLDLTSLMAVSPPFFVVFKIHNPCQVILLVPVHILTDLSLLLFLFPPNCKSPFHSGFVFPNCFLIWSQCSAYSASAS